MKSRYFEDFSVGESRGSTGRTITETDILLHAGQTGDFYPHHVDAEWCRTQPIGQRVAHGTLTFCVAVGMTVGEINPEQFSYGYDRLRFIKPVFIGDTLRVTTTLRSTQAQKKPGLGLLVESIEAYTQRGEVVLACDHLTLVRHRSAAVGTAV